MLPFVSCGDTHREFRALPEALRLLFSHDPRNGRPPRHDGRTVPFLVQALAVPSSALDLAPPATAAAPATFRHCLVLQNGQRSSAEQEPTI